MKNILAILVLVGAAIFAPVSVLADDAAYENELARQWKLMPRTPKILRYPSTESWEVYGLDSSSKLKSSADAIGGKALEIKVNSATPNPWDIGVQAANQVAVSKGDVVVAAFWGRASKLPSGKHSAEIPANLQLATEPYTQISSLKAELTSDWRVFYLHGTASMNFGKEALNLALHAGGARQTIELGPMFLWSLGPGEIDPFTLPKSSETSLSPKPTVHVTPSAKIHEGIVADISKTRGLVPSLAVLINNPDVSAASAFGENKSFKHVKDRGVPGGKAIEVNVRKPGINSWSAGVNWPTHTEVKKGDTVLLAYWAKAVDVHNEAQTGNIFAARVQQSGEPYDSAANQAASIDKTWRLYFAQGRSASEIAPGSSGISFHLGLAKQTIRIGPAYILNYGPEVDPETLPQTLLTYDGMDQDAPWRNKALANIEKYRKADFSILVTDENGLPKTNTEVQLQMTSHAFNFGTFVGHEFVKDGGVKDETYHKSFHANFNMATAPLYWQDWGWNGGFAKDYRANVKYLHENNIRWRGHPIIWPGKAYMPSNIKAAEGDLKKQRKMVLEHVRDVMSFVKDYDPFAIDLVNEVRTNHYFLDQGDAELVKDAFHLAHEIAPDIPLFVNDYGILNSGGLNLESIEFYHDWIQKMLDANVPLGGIGFQGHFGAGLTPPARVIEILDEFAKYNLPLHITEFDVDTLDVDAQAAYTRDILIAAFSQPDIEAFIIWGWWEGDHWKSAAAMLREDWSEKPNYASWRNLVYGDWWTNETLITDQDGIVRVRGFKGDYKVISNGMTSHHKLHSDSDIEITR